MSRIADYSLWLGGLLLLGAAILFHSATASSQASHWQTTEKQRVGDSSEPVLVELFTSQGCSSCPPADELAYRLDQESGLVVVSRPVDYWDRLGWKDTLASPENTALQRAYARRGLQGYNGVYTPQMVVQGEFGEVGSQERKVRRQIRSARAFSNLPRMRVRNFGERGFGVGIAGAGDKRLDIVLLGVSRRERVAIGRGENNGRSITYTNVLKGERRIGSWSGGTQSVPLPARELNIKGADRYAIVLRERSGGRVLAARWLE